MSPYCAMNSSKLGSRSSPRSRCSSIWFSARREHRASAPFARRPCWRKRVGGAFEEGVRHLAWPQLLDQLLEALTRLGRDEVVDTAELLARAQQSRPGWRSSAMRRSVATSSVTSNSRSSPELCASSTRSSMATPFVLLYLVELAREARPCGRRGRLRPASRPAGARHRSSMSHAARAPARRRRCGKPLRRRRRSASSRSPPGQEIVGAAGEQVVKDRGRRTPGVPKSHSE